MKRVTTAALLAALATLPAHANERAPGDHYGTFTYENDLLAGTDRYHTSGFQFAWRSSSYDPPDWLAAVTRGDGIVVPVGGTPRSGLAVAQDIFLDGNTWRDSRSVDKESFVGDASAGFALIMPFARLTVTYTARSRDFQTQRETAQYGSASLSFRF